MNDAPYWSWLMYPHSHHAGAADDGGVIVDDERFAAMVKKGLRHRTFYDNAPD